MKLRFAAAVLISGLGFSAYGAKAPSSGVAKGKVEYARAQTEFTDACRESFRKSTTPTAEEIGKTICECTAKDAKSQGATVSSLRKEASEIRKDSKHEIKDEHIMNAFRACTIELMQKEDEAHHAS